MMTQEKLEASLKDSFNGDYNAMIAGAALYKAIYGTYPKIGLSGAQVGFIDGLVAELPRSAKDELHDMQMAGVMTASVQNTPDSVKARITRDNPYWTQAYADVCTAVDREMQHRSRVWVLEAGLERIATAWSAINDVAKGCKVYADAHKVICDVVRNAERTVLNPVTCCWKRDQDGNYFTDCKNGFVLTSDGPKENGMKFCPFCGLMIVESNED